MEVEIKRKIIHSLGVFTILLIQVFGRLYAAVIILFITIAGFLIVEYRMNRSKYRLIKSKKIDEFHEIIDDELKTVERKHTLPFKGAIEFGLGCFLATILFQENIAIACIAVLSLADSVSTLVGYYYGKYKLPINKKKSWEGSAAFFVVAFFVLIFFTNYQYAIILAIVATIVEALPFFDDNLSIPVALGIAMSLIL